jgi:oligopeptide/dipeptide ABC transporter ATP-binding protein
LFISHDLHVVGYMSDRIAVMYLGKIVEIGKTKDILNGAMHPYTQALLSAIPEPGLELELTHLKEEASLVNPSSGCRFLPRCAYKKLKCEQIEPGLAEVDKGHQVACHLV